MRSLSVLIGESGPKKSLRLKSFSVRPGPNTVQRRLPRHFAACRVARYAAISSICRSVSAGVRRRAGMADVTVRGVKEVA